MISFDKSKVTIIVTAILFILLSGIVGALVRKSNPEYFTNQEPSIINLFKARLFNKNGIYNFYSSGEAGSTFFQNRENEEYVKEIVTFYPNYNDFYCLAVQGADAVDSDRCQNFLIDNFSCHDTTSHSLSLSSNLCSSINSGVGAQGDNCMLRCMHNYYKLVKRCILFNSINIVKTRYGNTSDAYEITVTGDISSFILSRPMFISFGNYGLYSILHIDYSTKTNCLKKFSSSDLPSYSFFITRVEPLLSRYAMDSASTATLNELVANKSIDLKKFPVTIYYLNYHNMIVVSKDNDAFNYTHSMTLVFSKERLEGMIADRNNIQNTSATSYLLNLATNAQGTASTFVPSMISVLYDIKTKDAVNVFKIDVKYGNTIISLSPHADFLKKITELREQNIKHKYHIVVTYSLDMMIIASFIKVDGMTKDFVYYIKHDVSQGSTRLVLKYNIKELSKQLRSDSTQGLLVDINDNRQILNLTSIPNFALLGKSLGYIF